MQEVDEDFKRASTADFARGVRESI